MKNKAKKRKRIIIWGVVIGLFALFCDSRFRMVTTHYELSYANLPQSFDGFCIVQISDLHSREYGEDNERLLSTVLRQIPDIIVITGDLINRTGSGTPSGQALELAPFLKKLSAAAPCYFVTGNHEWAGSDLPELTGVLSDCGIHFLRNEYEPITKDGQSIILAGVNDPNGPADMLSPPELVAEIKSAYPESFLILLGHRNDFLEKYPSLDADLVFCGHAHGGIWRIPGVGGLVGTERNLFPKYTEGVCSNGEYDLVVSRGLGDAAPTPRLLNNPELVSVTLRCK